MNEKMNMEGRILRHLQVYGSITTWEAIKEYGCTRLSHYIWLLRTKEKYRISDEIIVTKNRFGDNTHYKKYYFDKDNLS